MIRLSLLIIGLSTSAAFSNPITQVPYDTIAQTAAGLIDFEEYPVLPEPGQAIQGTIHAPGAALGAMLNGQALGEEEGFAALEGAPTRPPRVLQPTHTPPHAVAFHAGFGSNALFPLGPDGFEKRSGRGEGVLAISFDAPIQSFALRLHLDYADPLGSRPAPGPVQLHFYGADASLSHVAQVTPGHGVHSFGFQSDAPIMAITLTHQDPGGIAIDDIRYSLKNLAN
ncbi:hypothetical protein SAMN04488030_0828 [Aliiroseovarius halocynthiae]|uniref:PEP-CTERM sorting domain-containing protein n=1 Tax=Aliiroseovarius halocynthiae TaxID=985055 RepID=A0A545SUX8_9RHOB|nr:hypothetical protein [Aliiroseovarius halocynthiae]TQV68777.1 hypothetical protein FIL88_04125 [Aliiroseovarius halocynthiae]SMR71201.1 hypothetical protein SAMN04488030_0828 [Aliiroseovarius halocynthiae]